MIADLGMKTFLKSLIYRGKEGTEEALKGGTPQNKLSIESHV